MTRDKSRFIELKREKGGNITFGNDAQGKIIGKGIVHLGSEKVKEKKMFS